MPHPFLSDEWMAEAKAIRERYAGQTAKVTQALKINQVVTGAPFGDGTVESYLDTSSGDVVMDLGQLDDADATVTTDYATAKAIFVDQDQAAGMQAFMTGKITVQGDMMKLMAMQTAMPTDEGVPARSPRRSRRSPTLSPWPALGDLATTAERERARRRAPRPAPRRSSGLLRARRSRPSSHDCTRLTTPPWTKNVSPVNGQSAVLR